MLKVQICQNSYRGVVPLPFPDKVSAFHIFATDAETVSALPCIEFQGVHHVGLLCGDLEKSLAFYEGVLGGWARQSWFEGSGCLCDAFLSLFWL